MPPNTSTFRSVERHSYARANIFALESIVVLAAYIWALRIRLSNAAPKRCALLEGFGAVYFARLNFMTTYLLQRELALEELTVVMLLWLPSILGSFVYLSSEDSDLTCTESIILVAMYLLGSFLNTYSEYQRKIRGTKAGAIPWVCLLGAGISITLAMSSYSPRGLEPRGAGLVS